MFNRSEILRKAWAYYRNGSRRLLRQGRRDRQAHVPPLPLRQDTASRRDEAKRAAKSVADTAAALSLPPRLACRAAAVAAMDPMARSARIVAIRDELDQFSTTPPCVSGRPIAGTSWRRTPHFSKLDCRPPSSAPRLAVGPVAYRPAPRAPSPQRGGSSSAQVPRALNRRRLLLGLPPASAAGAAITLTGAAAVVVAAGESATLMQLGE